MSLRKILIAIVSVWLSITCVYASQQTVSVENNAPAVSINESIGNVNINLASAEEISEKLKGIGPSKAKAIVEYREQHGAFSSVESMLDVKGIGAATLEKNKNKIVL